MGRAEVAISLDSPWGPRSGVLAKVPTWPIGGFRFLFYPLTIEGLKYLQADFSYHQHHRISSQRSSSFAAAVRTRRTFLQDGYSRTVYSQYSAPIVWFLGQFHFLDSHGSALQVQLILDRKGKEKSGDNGCILCPYPWAQTHRNFINCIIWSVLPDTHAQGNRREILSLCFLFRSCYFPSSCSVGTTISKVVFGPLEKRQLGNADSFPYILEGDCRFKSCLFKTKLFPQRSIFKQAPFGIW